MKVRTGVITTLGAGAVLVGFTAGPALASSHPVQAGDTMSGIAAQSGVPLSQVEAANPQIANPDAISVGDVVNVPGGQSGAAPAPTPSSTAAPAGGTSSTGTSSTGTSSTGASSTGTSSSSGTASTGATGSFQSCVAFRESSNVPTRPDGLYGILPGTWASLGYSGTAGQSSVATQNAAFQKLYARDGTSPWSPYDGC
jgi:LysM repeat protein